MTRLVDYFVLCGLRGQLSDVNAGKNVNYYFMLLVQYPVCTDSFIILPISQSLI